MSSPRLTNKHTEEILNISCMPVLGQPHIQLDIIPTTEIARINIFATTAKKYLMGKRAYNSVLRRTIRLNSIRHNYFWLITLATNNLILISDLPTGWESIPNDKSRTFDIMSVREWFLAKYSSSENPLYISQLAFSVSHILQARKAHLLSTGVVRVWLH